MVSGNVRSPCAQPEQCLVLKVTGPVVSSRAIMDKGCIDLDNCPIWRPLLDYAGKRSVQSWPAEAVTKSAWSGSLFSVRRRWPIDAYAAPAAERSVHADRWRWRQRCQSARPARFLSDQQQTCHRDHRPHSLGSGISFVIALSIRTASFACEVPANATPLPTSCQSNLLKI